MDRQAIEVVARNGRGKGAARRLRAANGVPAIVYGSGCDSTAVQVGGDTTARTLVNAANDKGLGIFSITPGSNNLQGVFPSTTLATSANSDTHYQVDLDVTLKNTGD